MKNCFSAIHTNTDMDEDDDYSRTNDNMMIQKKIHSMDRVSGFGSLPYLIKKLYKII